ncbi:hypothetical protein BN1221_02944c [Brenneria goodwinii]|uniref:Uncharacterized protein n=1 Tax=Brenneria goodwinii TaxID=1109412 RepID=A0A0G4JX21_9GAMM|nr:hypothetical protein BN1221_02944c [Brenneria goodwinii]
MPFGRYFEEREGTRILIRITFLPVIFSQRLAIQKAAP